MGSGTSHAARASQLFVLALGLLVSGPASAAPPPPPVPPADDPLGYAPEGEWPMPDGCPARTRATPTRLPEGEWEEAWTWQGPAPIAGEPVVAQGRVFLGTHPDGKGNATLDVLRLEDGKPVLPRRTFTHGQPVLPTAWRDLVVVPATATTVEAFRLGIEEQRLVSLGTFPGAGERLVLDGDVITVTGRNVERRRPGAPTPKWTYELDGTALGPPSARSETVFVVTARRVEGYQGYQSRLEAIHARTGTFRLSAEIGWHDDSAPPGAESRIVVAPGELYVRHGVGFLMKDRAPMRGLRVPLANGWIFEPNLREVLHLDLAPVVWGHDALVRSPDSQDEVVLFRSDSVQAARQSKREEWRWHALATPTRHPGLLATDSPPVIAAGIAVFPGGRFEVGTQRLLEVRRAPHATRRIPVRETLLDVGEDRVVAWRAKERPSPIAGGPTLPTSPGASPVAVPGALLVLRDGSWRAGEVAYDPTQRTLALGKTKVALDEVGLVVDAEGGLVHGPDPTFVVQRVQETAALRSRPAWLALAKRAVATRSAVVLRQAIDDLAARGGRAEDLVALRKELVKLEKPLGAPPKQDVKKLEAVRHERDRLLRAEGTALERAIASLPETTPILYRGPLLRALLASDPKHASATAWVRARLPAGFDPGTEAAPLDWLDLVQAMGQSPLTVLPPKPEGKDLSLDDRHYGSLRTTWRKDLVALRSDRLFLVTPVARPSRIARCLSLGELVCSTLDTLFEVTPEQARQIDPLCVQLFETRQEYLHRSTQGDPDRERGHARLAWTAGHYDAGEGLSRLFVPPGDDRFDGVMETLAHELTHHWLDQRMPLPPGTVRTSYGAASPGYFLEEGFATMVEEFVFDLDARTFSPVNPRADSLDIVASAPALLDWATVVEMSPRGFAHLPREGDHKVNCQWKLGRHRLLSDTNFFYAQGAAICHYLWNAENGRRRAILREWVRDLHRGVLGPGETQRRLEMSPAHLGAAVTAWCRQVTSPKK